MKFAVEGAASRRNRDCDHLPEETHCSAVSTQKRIKQVAPKKGHNEAKADFAGQTYGKPAALRKKGREAS